ncbi:hypothetical protein HK098_002299 [Nowakowskiella sp. JEL0407]|nr:hypothetical protein HK098_002299 [Nowakowskiella sp. JEL0407]
MKLYRGQCGGQYYTGAKFCQQGSTCTYVSNFYSQCTAVTSPSPSPLSPSPVRTSPSTSPSPPSPSPRTTTTTTIVTSPRTSPSPSPSPASVSCSSASGSFGISATSSSIYTVTTGCGLVYQVNRGSCDITSMVYNGIEVQDSSKKTHLISGLGTATVTGTTVDSDTVMISCETANLTHYMVTRRNINTIYLATYLVTEPSIGEIRFIARLKRTAVPNGIPAAQINGGGSAVEGSDVYYYGTETRSKFYSGVQFYKDQVHGVTGSGVGVYMVIPSTNGATGYESSSGGPFHKDINNQGGDQQELYFYMNSGHTQTEDFRADNVLHGPYALTFTTGASPSANPDLSFFNKLSIKGFVPVSKRGYVTGTASGVPSGYECVIHWKNSVAQYWAIASSSGSFSSPPMKPGTYTMVMYKNELEVGSQTVTVSAGSTTTSNIGVSSAGSAFINVPSSRVFIIGDWDGTPAGFQNTDKLPYMHPVDSRMTPWDAAPTFTVGSSSLSSFPAVLWKSVNSPLKINFSLTAAQAATSKTLRIGITLAFAGGRPQVTVNDAKYSSSIPAITTQPDSRGITRGTYRGNNSLFTYTIPAGALNTGSNSLLIYVVSGSSGTTYLSPNFVFDAIDMY